MGGVLSGLIGVGKTAKLVAGVLRDLYRQYNEIDARLNEAPGLPRPSPTRSFWLEDPPYPELVDVRSDTLPACADVVIIGSGITGVAVARSLLEERPASSDEKTPQKPSVVVLEARQLCSGATGRNGGHIKASPHETLDHLVNKMGLPGARAAALVRFQLAHLEHLLALCNDEEEGHGALKAAECREVETVDLFVDEGAFRAAREQVALLHKWVPEYAIQTWTASEAQEKYSAGSHVVGAISYRAGALWPYRLVATLWRRLLDANPDRLSIETGTPAEVVQVLSSSSSRTVLLDEKSDSAIDLADYPYRVATPRGTVRARHVVHATNAFASQLLPALRRKMTGFRAHMSAQRPGPRFPDLGGTRSWSIIFAHGFDYITQRPTATMPSDGRRQPGELMAGGGFARSAQQGADQMAVFDDTRLDLFTTTHLHGILPTVFGPRWGPDGGGGDDADGQGDGHVKSIWSGIVAVTADMRPFVGRLDPRLTGRRLPKAVVDAQQQQKQQQQQQASRRNRVATTTTAADSGEWISAAYIGDGMVWAWLCGTALGLMVAGRDHEDLPPRPGRPAGKVVDWFPAELHISYDRVHKIDISDLAELLL